MLSMNIPRYFQKMKDLSVNNQKSETEYKSNSTIEFKSIGGELGRISIVFN